jgi:hypothetical protein
VLPEAESTPVDRAELILAIAARRKGASARAIGIEADLVAAWRLHSFGKAKTITPTRNPVYACEMSTGVRGIAGRDVAEGIADGGADGRATVRAYLDAAYFALEEAEKAAAAEESLDAAIADFARESSDVSIARLKNKSDAELVREADEAINSGRKLKAILAARRRKVVAK